ncbi:lipopolysaccharide-induced tumor necrosis factor-alpha factor homolog [Drosophila subpulchrella]|uniref:lipopolysaccharide-induced tumor necrosis factor-alpha factor homolog n=1 Tax=Drosophila subpulchrella TaxID=1486046 RepID=UPI0018A14969|nr:lipopolysaccharide-induced tumor necrosis factor-alpha factor homolog [Drosophila subpulchrella]
MSPAVGPKPCTLFCPNCSQRVTTRVKSKSTTKTHILALILCCLMCWPCACCLYCTKLARNSNHYCPNCKAFVGTYKR